MTTTHGALLVIGSGPGIGIHTASLFAARGFSHILLVSRSASRLQTDAEAVRAAAPNAIIDTIAADVSSASSLNAALAEAESKLAQSRIPLETVFFNAARVGESKVLEFPVETLEEDFRVRNQCHRPAIPLSSTHLLTHALLDRRLSALHHRAVGIAAPPRLPQLPSPSARIPAPLFPRHRRVPAPRPVPAALLAVGRQGRAAQPRRHAVQDARARRRALRHAAGGRLRGPGCPRLQSRQYC
ncbi:uncharacterized protein K452DRAFT_164611 [Aplosporella prunicola CBS 121167]|uniref:Ketoreductase (KR) domain-containing protein n=1 Tax=Aplosporella prunicola CBS 121167 TaxID=1176127 RepID=A0A6A6AWW2_9PEZI|nr:uncharacterized protein K452DRAFT_164611 [Aplosporella prunicola CBS 121167]KAF2135758.1 hypothetical protein K452DRAFT_164611 [Aplosporella prunicola CBS 121167]